MFSPVSALHMPYLEYTTFYLPPCLTFYLWSFKTRLMYQLIHTHSYFELVLLCVRHHTSTWVTKPHKYDPCPKDKYCISQSVRTAVANKQTTFIFQWLDTMTLYFSLTAQSIAGKHRGSALCSELDPGLLHGHFLGPLGPPWVLLHLASR